MAESTHGASHRGAYVAFDRFPSSKGAGIHIGQMADELFDHTGGGLLAALGGRGLPGGQWETRPGGPVEIARFAVPVPNLLDRAAAFSRWAAGRLGPHLSSLRLCHVRDPWSALAVLGREGWGGSLVYEVNGLPSIELGHTWPAAAPATLAKIRSLERACLDAAEAVVVPSAVIADLVRSLGVPGNRLHLIPNGANPAALRPPRPVEAPARYVLYVGALQPWQGVDVLLRAYARLADLSDASDAAGLALVICSSVPQRRARPLMQLARRLSVADRVHWRWQLPHSEVAAWLAHAELSVAPLTGCARNTEQGCSPLKILESMAAGTAVVASDLPAVRELIIDGVHGKLVQPDRPAELARALRVLLEYPDVAAGFGAAGRRRVVEGLTWAHARAALREVYRSIG